MRTWFVGDMDEGVLVHRPTRREAVTWLLDHECASRVVQRHAYGRGAYDYLVADDTEQVGSGFIARLDHAEDHGFDPDQPPLYADPAHPHERTREGT